MSIPLNARRAFNAETTGDNAIALMTITDPIALVTPLRFSTHPTVRLSVDPLEYGTISNGVTYPIGLSEDFLSDSDTGPRTMTATIENVSQSRVAVIRSLTDSARVSINLVMASAPDDVVRTVANLRVLSRSYDQDNVLLDLSSQQQGTSASQSGAVPWPSMRQTRDRAPGLHK